MKEIAEKKKEIWVFTFKNWRGGVVVNDTLKCCDTLDAIEKMLGLYRALKVNTPKDFKGVKVLKTGKYGLGLETQFWINENLDYGAPSYSLDVLEKFENCLK